MQYHTHHPRSCHGQDHRLRIFMLKIYVKVFRTSLFFYLIDKRKFRQAILYGDRSCYKGDNFSDCICFLVHQVQKCKLWGKFCAGCQSIMMTANGSRIQEQKIHEHFVLMNVVKVLYEKDLLLTQRICAQEEHFFSPFRVPLQNRSQNYFVRVVSLKVFVSLRAAPSINKMFT